MNNQNIINTIIPLPQKIKVNEGVLFDKKRISININTQETLKIKRAYETLKIISQQSSFASDFFINLSILDSNKDRDIIKKLSKSKYKEQTYAIIPIIKKKVFIGLDIKGYSDLGLLYGARTLIQAIKINNDEIYIPLITVFDWPDIEFRGQWGGSSNCDIPYTSQYKFNAIDGKVFVNLDKDGNTMVVHSERLYKQANEFGVDIAATIPHLELIARRGFVKNKKEILSTPSKERSERSDFIPSICMSAQATKDMVYEWFVKIAENDSVKKILVWLSEEESPCFCDDCKGKEPFSLEVACLLNAYSRIKKQYPYIKFGIMLSQGSFKATKNIINMLPKDVSLTFYDGGRTYDSGQYEMILPELNDYAKKGGLLGVYPQITHSWRITFPMSSPYFIKYRCDEFVKKNIHRIITYAIPDNRYHDYNLLAFLEWSWNNKGRNEKQFTYSYALINDLNGSLYYKFIKTLKNPSWDLAHSKLFLRLMYNYPLILRNSLEFDDHRFEMSEILEIKNIKKDILLANEAIKIAKEMNNNELIYEAKSIYGGLLAYVAITKFISEIAKKSINSDVLVQSYNDCKYASNIVYKNILKWSKEILNEKEKYHTRLYDTATVLFRVLDGMKRYFDDTNVKTEKDKQRVEHIGSWDEQSFNGEKAVLLNFDITDNLQKHKKGTYNVSLDFVEGQSGTDITRIFVREIQKAGGEKTTAQVYNNFKRLSVWGPWAEYKLKINKVKSNCRYKLYIDIEGMENDEKTCRGIIGLRKI